MAEKHKCLNPVGKEEAIMKTNQSLVNVRPMVYLDFAGIIAINEKIRTTPTAVTYKDFNIGKIFRTDWTEEKPNILEVAKLIDLGFVAEAEGSICGFIMGRQTYIAEYGVQEGEVAIVAVDPDYRRKGIATKLLNALSDLFRSRGVHRIRMAVDPLDNDMLALLKRTGFSGQRLLNFTKSL